MLCLQQQLAAQRQLLDSDTRKASFKLPPRSLTLYGELLSSLRTSPAFVMSVASTLPLAARNDFVKVTVQRLCSRYVTSSEEALLPIIREGIDMGTKAVNALRQFVKEICELPEIR